MNIIIAPHKYNVVEGEVSLFLAGGITNCDNWQNKVIKTLEQYNLYKLVVFNPRRDNFPIDNPSASYEQVEWEFKALERCDIFSMYFSGGESVQPICMYELGRNILRTQIKSPVAWKDRIIISVESGYKRKNDVVIQTELACGEGLVNVGDDTDDLIKIHCNAIADAYNKIKFG